MKRICVTLLLCVCANTLTFSQDEYPLIKVADDIEITKLSDHAYIHTSYADMPPWKRVASNGLIFVNNGKAFLFDTPANDTLTEKLVNWVEKKLKTEIIGFVPNHWHSDCMGGIGYLHRRGIGSYAYELTREIAKGKDLTVPRHGFSDSLVFSLGKEKVISKYYGAAHSLDNIVTWIPSEKILFAGCMVRSLASTSLGHTGDGDLKAWPITLRKIIDAYPDVRIVIPGHGHFGGIELIRHTLELLKAKEGNLLTK
jgi:metallo-beta-lactamase class B